MDRIAAVLPDGGNWCSLDKAQTLAAIVLATRPRVIVEIGVWLGGSLVPMLLALRHLVDVERAGGAPAIPRKAIAIDPWDSAASVTGQAEVDATWWRAQDHAQVLKAFQGRLRDLELAELCDVVRQRSDDAAVPGSIDLLHVDGNHAEQAERDVGRFAAAVVPGGFLVLDDVHWSGGHVDRARQLALATGFAQLYPLGSGIVLQRTGR